MDNNTFDFSFLEKYLKNLERALSDRKEYFGKALNKELEEIRAFYKTEIELAEKNSSVIPQLVAGNSSVIAQLKAEQLEAEKNAVTKHVTALLKTETDLNIRKINIDKDAYLFKADLRKKELEELIASKEKEITLLESVDEGFRTDEHTKQLKEAKVAQAEYNAEMGRLPAQKLGEVLASYKKIGDQLAKTGGTVGEIFSGLSGQMDNITTAFSKDPKVSSADKYTSAISSAITLIDMVTSANKKRKEAEAAYNKNALAFAQQYALALNEQLRLQSQISGSKFVTDYQGKINDGFGAMAEASAKYNESVGKLSEGKAKTGLKNSVNWGNVAKGAAAGAVIGSVIPGIGTAIGAAVGAIGGAIVGFFGGKSKKNEWGNLLDVAPGIVDESGNLNKKMAEALLQTDQVDDKTKQLIEDSLKWADAVEKAKEQIKGVVTELAGDLGNSLNNAMLGAWKNGEDASKSMFDAAGKSLENFLQNLLYSAMFADTFKDFEDRLVESLSPNGDNDILDDYDWLMDEMAKKDDIYIQQLEALQKRAGEKGFNLWEKQKKEINLGLSLDSIQKELDQLVIQADLTFENISKSFASHMSDAILHMVKSKHLTEKLNEWYQHFAVAMEDGELTREESDGLREKYQQTVETSNQIYKDAMAAAGLDIPNEREASARGVASMSQESAEELNGNFYALIFLVDDIHKIMQKRYGISDTFNLTSSDQNSVLPTMEDLLEVSRSSNTYLLDIRNNTSHLIAIDTNLASMNYNIMAIRNDGLKMRS